MCGVVVGREGDSDAEMGAAPAVVPYMPLHSDESVPARLRLHAATSQHINTPHHASLALLLMHAATLPLTL